MRLCYARIDLATLVRLVAANFETLAADRNILFAVYVPPELPVEADWEKVERMLINLLANAFKFTPDGGAVFLVLEVRAERAVVVVRDTGPGVAENCGKPSSNVNARGRAGLPGETAAPASVWPLYGNSPHSTEERQE